MKDKKIIAYKNEQVKKFAYNLRRLIIKTVMQEWSRLGEEQRRIRLESSKHKVTLLTDWREVNRLKNKALVMSMDIEDERSDLYGALHASICICPSCHQTARTMVYNAPLGEWYCTDCAQEYREYYQKEKTIYGDLAEDADFYETFL